MIKNNSSTTKQHPSDDTDARGISLPLQAIAGSENSSGKVGNSGLTAALASGRAILGLDGLRHGTILLG